MQLISWNKVLMIYIIITLIFINLPVSANNIDISDGNLSITIIDVEQYGLESFTELDILKKYFKLKLLIAPSARHWKLIEKQKNVCLTTRIMTKKRNKVAFFSQYPTNVNYPHILLVNKKYGLSSPLDLLELTKKQASFRLGVIKDNSHGIEIDAILKKIQPDNIVNVTSSANPSKTLYTLLRLNRIDAFITTRDEVNGELSVQEKNDYFIADVYGANQNTYGYLACSKSDLGKMIINTFDQAMQKNAIRATFLQTLQDKNELTLENIEHLQNKYQSIDKELNIQSDD